MKIKLLISSCALFLVSVLHASSNPFVGHWGITTPDGRAGWLGVEERDGVLAASVMWPSGSVLPADEAQVSGEVLSVKRTIKLKGKISRQTITATCQGDDMKLTAILTKEDGTELEKGSCTAKRLPPIPPRPELSKVVWGEPVHLISQADMNGWQLVKEGARSGWSIKDGILSNRVGEEKGQRSANLRTTATFEDFRLTTEVRTLKQSNSGIYLRGMYEIQIEESFGKPVDSHNMGALYSRITPSVAAEKPIGEWQTLEITLVDRHLTVVLNGSTIIDNQPVLGCTGGALTSDDSLRGPIMLQGDHSSIDYRNMVLTPVRK